ncbi:MAG TPA: copper resistance protein NlpE N-terminal domain-containing protein [Acidobacteriaceae bacterium]|nr:copper resistance protein NlpE N-terminal domain-containing protein [Acidobacteriaceae bacterium]
MHDRTRFWSFFLALSWLMLAALGVLRARAGQIDLTGTYQGHAPAADAARRVFTLSLSPDGSAVFTTQYIGKSDVVEHGRWSQDGSQVVLRLDAMGPNRPPGAITFRHQDHQLRPVHWDPSEWGRRGPPVLHRSHSMQGGF